MYSISSEWSKNFKGFRAVVTNEISGKISYLGANLWKTEKLAEGEAEAYAVGYATGGDATANHYVRKYVKNNK